jgi:hypothetical protein
MFKQFDECSAWTGTRDELSRALSMHLGGLWEEFASFRNPKSLRKEIFLKGYPERLREEKLVRGPRRNIHKKGL